MLLAAAAARELHVTQAAVSQQIRALEDQLGTKLFVRGPRGLAPTPHGEDLAAATRRALAGLNESMARIAGTAAGVLTLSTLPSFASRWLVPRLDRFQRRHPEIELRLHIGGDVVNLLGSSIDAAIRFGPAGACSPRATTLCSAPSPARPPR